MSTTTDQPELKDMNTDLKENPVTQPIVRKVGNVLQITKSGLLKDKEDGLTIPQMAEKYKVSKASLTKALRMAGITKRARTITKIEIIDDTNTTSDNEN